MVVTHTQMQVDERKKKEYNKYINKIKTVMKQHRIRKVKCFAFVTCSIYESQWKLSSKESSFLANTRQEQSIYENLLPHKVTLQHWASNSPASQEKQVRGIQNDIPREHHEEQPAWETCGKQCSCGIREVLNIVSSTKRHLASLFL